MNPYTKMSFDLDELPFLTNPYRQLELRSVALGLIRLPAGQGYTFTHRHREQEEVYIVIGGSGELLVEKELVTLERGDLVRVAPTASRALRAGSAGLLAICAGAVGSGYPKDPGARYLIDDGEPDYDDVPPWYRDDPGVVERNQQLKQRMLRAREKRGEPSGES